MSERDLYNQIAVESRPTSTQPKRKRDAPSARLPIRQDPERQARKYGRPKTFRLPDDFIDMLEMVQEKYGVRPPELIQLTVTQYVEALEAGKVKLPVKRGPQAVTLDLPDVPDVRAG